jgi:hypothetical protein
VEVSDVDVTGVSEVDVTGVDVVDVYGLEDNEEPYGS